MTFVGKLFVLVNVGLSLFWAAAAFALYANSIEWGYDPKKPGSPGGLLAEKDKQIKDLQAQQFPLESAWKDARALLRKSDEDRREERQFYTVQFEHNARKAAAGSVARIVELRAPLAGKDAGKEEVRNHLAMLDPANKNRPKLVDAKDRTGKDLVSRVVYEKEVDDSRKENASLLARLDEETKKTMAFTEKMLDRPPLKGLRTLLVEERNKREGVIEEQQLVRPLFVNTAVESELILKRLEGLQERIKELQNYIKKRKMDIARLER